jgi:hypothetical protein
LERAGWIGKENWSLASVTAIAAAMVQETSG